MASPSSGRVRSSSCRRWMDSSSTHQPLSTSPQARSSRSCSARSTSRKALPGAAHHAQVGAVDLVEDHAHLALGQAHGEELQMLEAGRARLSSPACRPSAGPGGPGGRASTAPGRTTPPPGGRRCARSRRRSPPPAAPPRPPCRWRSASSGSGPRPRCRTARGLPPGTMTSPRWRRASGSGPKW